MKLDIILGLLCINNNLIKPTTINKNSGLDERYPLEEDNSSQLFNINKYFEMRKLLDILKNNEIDDKTKMSILNKYSLLFEDNFVPDITKGGLLEDFNFDYF